MKHYYVDLDAGMDSRSPKEIDELHAELFLMLDNVSHPDAISYRTTDEHGVPIGWHEKGKGVRQKFQKFLRQRTPKHEEFPQLMGTALGVAPAAGASPTSDAVAACRVVLEDGTRCGNALKDDDEEGICLPCWERMEDAANGGYRPKADWW